MLINRLIAAEQIADAATLLDPDWRDDYVLAAVLETNPDYSILDFAADVVRDNLTEANFTHVNALLLRIFRSTQRDPGAPGYPERSGQRVDIVRPYGDDEIDLDEVGPMFLVRFADGLEIDAFGDELETI